jgi:hypothetical protein
MSVKTHNKKVARRSKVLKTRKKFGEKDDKFRRRLGITKKQLSQLRRIFMDDEIKVLETIWKAVEGLNTDARARVLQYSAQRHAELANKEAEEKKAAIELKAKADVKLDADKKDATDKKDA